MKRNNPEYSIQCMVAWYLDNHPKHPLWCASSGGMRTSIGTATKMKRSGYSKGFPDIFVYEPKRYVIKDNFCLDGHYELYCGLAIEIKTKAGEPYPETKKGKPSVEQYTWIKQLNENGYRAVICYGYQECVEEINKYLGV
jgi:hypothetical protein